LAIEVNDRLFKEPGALAVSEGQARCRLFNTALVGDEPARLILRRPDTYNDIELAWLMKLIKYGHDGLRER
jgi:hypothetical protein